MSRKLCGCGKEADQMWYAKFEGKWVFVCQMCWDKQHFMNDWEPGKHLRSGEYLCPYCGKLADLEYHVSEHKYFGDPAGVLYGCSNCMVMAEAFPEYDYTYKIVNLVSKEIVWEGKKGQRTH